MIKTVGVPIRIIKSVTDFSEQYTGARKGMPRLFSNTHGIQNEILDNGGYEALYQQDAEANLYQENIAINPTVFEKILFPIKKNS